MTSSIRLRTLEKILPKQIPEMTKKKTKIGSVKSRIRRIKEV